MYEILKSETDAGMDQPALILSIMLNMHGPELEAWRKQWPGCGVYILSIPHHILASIRKFLSSGIKVFQPRRIWTVLTATFSGT